MNDETIGNQQPSLTERELGWLAGLIDGEGCIYLCSRGGKRKDNYKAGVRIAMCCHDTIEYTSSLLHKINVPHHITKRSGNPAKNTSDSWAITVEGHKRVLKFLPLITEALITKKQQAQVVWQFSLQREAKWHAAPYDESDLALISAARVMNQRGHR